MEIRGLNLFIKHFAEYRDKFVLIGGSACHLNLEEHGLEFRSTKDIDIVLLLDIDKTDTAFTEAFWGFVKSGGYDFRQKSSNKPVFYRFTRPANKDYPFMLELFSRRIVSLNLKEEFTCTPIPATDELSSLSAILLNDGYYSLITTNIKKTGDIAVVNPECLIALKAKAFLDLRERKEKGERIDTNNINKHKKDVFRIAQMFSDENHCEVDRNILTDLRQFVKIVKEEPPDLKQMGIKEIPFDEILDSICKVFGIK
jgi:hypothetical protein